MTTALSRVWPILNHPKDDFGALAAQKLLHMIAGEREESAVLPWSLVERESLGQA